MARCKICRDKFEPKYFLQKACFNPACLAEWSKLDMQKKNNTTKKVKDIEYKEQKKKDAVRKKALMTRLQWFDRLQKVVNQWVREVKEAGQSCCTCNQSKDGYDCGHYKAVGRGGADRRRFTPMNLHRQCRHCNSFNGGKPVEYRAYLIERYGIDKVLWLEDESQHPTLKEQFPTTQDIENEIKRYRELLRAEGLTPNA